MNHNEFETVLHIAQSQSKDEAKELEVETYVLSWCGAPEYRKGMTNIVVSPRIAAAFMRLNGVINANGQPNEGIVKEFRQIYLEKVNLS